MVPLKPKIFALTFLAMIAFASNSLLCRAALRQSGIDAASFTFVRIVSGAVVLWLIVRTRGISAARRVSRRDAEKADDDTLTGSWPSAFALFIYAAAFSFAYNTLSAGTGALLLFGAVQATMIFWGLRSGEHLYPFQWVGVVTAIAGLVVLLFPGISAPPLIGSVLMLAAGIAWGIYSLRGRSPGDAIAATAGNFLRGVPFAAAASIVSLPWLHIDLAGTSYAVVSGAITSGLGYVIWYSALSGLSASNAATVQLSVPVLAATGGILFLNEPVTLRYALASVAVLGGIFLVIIEKRHLAGL